MQSLSTQRCLNHGTREAVARCPQCQQFFCRECITEHDDQVICASCLQKVAKQKVAQKHWGRYLVRLAQCVGGFLLCWLIFYAAGQFLISIPTAFHEGTIWESREWEEE